MRRNRDYGNGHAQQNQTGPLMTTHLRDLDIELELLKRKRDIIQQEQAVLNRLTNKRPYNNYEEPHNSYNREESTNQPFNNPSYSNRYEGPSSSGNMTRPQGPKRQATNKHWQSPSNPKRFSPQQKINPWYNNQGPRQNDDFLQGNITFQKNIQAQAFVSSQIRPLMGMRPSVGQKLQKNFPTQRKDFRPTKVTKPKNQPQKKDFPAEGTKKLVIKNSFNSKKPDSDMILRADKEPSVQLRGRLELALGTLMKELKLDHCKDKADLDVFHTPFIQRILKQTIRTRIKNVMLDRVVGHFTEVVSRYRMRFPKDTDLELVNIAKDAQSLSSKKAGVVHLIESDDPQIFYKKNIVKALGVKLDEIFSNLELQYAKPKQNLTDLIDEMPEPKEQTEEKAESAEETKPEHTERKTYEQLIGECEDPQQMQSKLNKVKTYVEFMDELIEQRLPKILPKLKDTLISILYSDREFLSMKAVLASQVKKRLTRTVEKDVLETINSEQSEKPEADTSLWASDDFSKDPVVEINLSKQGQETTESPKKTVEITPTSKQIKRNEAPATPKTPVSDLHFAKLLSRPSLPARAVIYDFLNQFKPTSIKKHKTIGNLLVIGFNNKENYDNFLKLGETTIGNSTLVIKPSEQVIKTPVSTPRQIRGTPKSADSTATEDSILGADLDSQITDLLSSIQKADETPNAEGKEKIKPSANNNDNTNTETSTIENVDTVEAMDTGNTDKNDHIETTNTENVDKDGNTKNIEQIEANNDNVNSNKAEDTGKTEESVNDNLENTKEKTEDNTNQEDKIDSALDAIAEDEVGKPVTPEKIKDLKDSGRNTPTRTSSRLANVTPSTIRTRRASRLANN